MSPGSSIRISLKINGRDHEFSATACDTLLDVLRDNLGMTGTKKGCDMGACGACTVLAEGRRIKSCLALAASCDCLSITTIEGVGGTDKLHQLQAAFIRHDALQCGPFLVDRGQPVPGLNDTRSARRSFVVASGSDRAAIGFCSGVTLAQLGKILGTPGLAPDLKVQRALNLDGGSSSAFWFAGERGPFSISEQKTVRNFVAVAPK